MSWIFVLVGILCLLALQFLRSALSMSFPTYTARPMQRPDASSFGGLDMIEAKTDALRALGFSGPAWVGSVPRAADTHLVTAHAVYRNDDTGVVAWVGPTIEIARPNSLLTYYTTLLDDGRFAVTQVSDPYFSTIDDPQTPAQTIAGSDEATELQAHAGFVADLGVPAARATPQQDVLHFAGEHMTAIRARLLERGRLREAAGIARPSLGLALQILRNMLSRPKSASDGDLTVPTSRLPFLARTVELLRKRAPSQGMQWLLLLISAALFVGIGWPLLGLQFTIIILAVIVLHEGGHWLAMRLYGYENPHITLLPLLGGVTIGHETDPSASKRAWVALAGPLPGIVLGWVLLSTLVGEPPAWTQTDTWFIGGVVVLLFINYLNILPVPPLDGAHVAQAILPPRWAGLQAIVIVAGVILGFYVAYLLDFWPLALIAALQLPAIRTSLRNARLVREFAGTCPEGDEATRRSWLFDQLQAKLGDPKAAARRIGLANTILHTLAVKPMNPMQRFVVSSVYAALLIVPVVALLLSLLTFGDDAVTDPFDDPALAAEFDRVETESSRLDLLTLVEYLADDGGAPPPADATSRLGAEARLGRRLPAHLAAFYDVADGLPGTLGLLPISKVARIDSELLETGELSYYVYNGALYFFDESGDLEIPLEEVRSWWQIGHNEEWYSRVFVDPDADAGQAAVFLFGEEPTAYASVTQLLRAEYAQVRVADIYEKQAALAVAHNRERLQDMPVEELMQQFRKPGLLERLITGEYFLPGPAGSAALDETEARIGRRLPDDHRAALRVSNGYSPAMLLPADAIQPAGNSAPTSIDFIVQTGIDAGYDEFSHRHLEACWAIGGSLTEVPDNDSEFLHASLFWCPDLPEGYQYLSTVSQTYYRSFREALLEYAVVMTSF